jgi:hypothetical protein
MSGQGVEIGTTAAGRIVLRDHATAEIYHNVTSLELVVDPLSRNGEEACPRLRVNVFNSARRPDAAPIPGGVQYLTITTPVFVEVRERLIRDPKEQRRRANKERRRENRKSRRRQEASVRAEWRRLRDAVKVNAATYAGYHATLVQLAETHPELQAFVVSLPVPETAPA